MSDYEYNLPTKESMRATDSFRAVVGRKSVLVSPEVAGQIIGSALNSAQHKQRVRVVSASGTISSGDNCIVTNGTITLTMPDPSLMYDAAAQTSTTITVTQRTPGTVTITPSGSAQFRDGSTGAPYPSWAITGGSAISFVSDGTDYISSSS